MSTWDKNKVLPENLNGGNEYANGDVPSLDTFNSANNNAFYAVDFAEALADTPDTTNVGNVGTPAISLIDNVKGGITYKKFKFENFKGNTGATGNGIASISKTGTSGVVDTYTVTFTDGTMTTFTVTNGKEIASVVLNGMTFTFTYTDGTTDSVTVSASNTLVTTPVPGVVSGVKGNAETTYRTGQVNITPDNIGAEISGEAVTVVTAHNDSSSAHSSLFASKRNEYVEFSGTSGTITVDNDTSNMYVYAVSVLATTGIYCSFTVCMKYAASKSSVSYINTNTLFRVSVSSGIMTLQSSTDGGENWTDDTSKTLYIRRLA